MKCPGTWSDDADALGMPRLSLHWRIDSSVHSSILRMQELLRQHLATTGIGDLVEGRGDIRFTDASHHMGTARMSVDPCDGVVDVNCKVHDVDNLYVAGSAVFPSAGYANPTLSIVALTLRLAMHLKA